MRVPPEIAVNKKALLLLAAFVLLSGALFLLIEFGFETLLSDAATRLAYQVRDEAAALRRSGETTRTFEHHPRSWPEGISGDYRVEIIECQTAPRPGHRSIGIARSPSEPAWYTTSYHLNFVEVPTDLIAAHRKGEPLVVTLEMKADAVWLIGLK